MNLIQQSDDLAGKNSMGMLMITMYQILINQVHGYTLVKSCHTINLRLYHLSLSLTGFKGQDAETISSCI